jgi:TonB family protein
MTGLSALVLSLTTLFAQQSPSNQAADAVSWPIPGVERPGQGVTAPILLHETKPNYTAAAMRARIQGLVVMECVVEMDGTVGPVRVTRSLDGVYGLDDEAVRTLKQWRFRPGTREGTPVRVAVIVEMSYTIGDPVNVRSPNPVLNPGTTAPIAWPDAFVDPREPAGASTSTWLEDSIQTPLVSLRFAYPSNWIVLKSSEADRIITLYRETPLGTRTIGISEPRPSTFTLSQPLQQSALDAFALGASRAPGSPPNIELLKAGQVLRPGGLWLWFEMAAPTIESRNAPAALADRLRTDYDGIHLWTFTTTVNSQSVSVFCAVMLRANSTDAEKQEEIRSAGLEFGEILRRITTQPR